MKVLSRLLLVFALVGFFTVDAWADKPKILQLKDLQPGTKAIGFSVFKGVEPEPFDVVLGEPIDQRGDSLILARIYGGPMDTLLERIGAISGMSGSPIFIGCTDLGDCINNGTLVGALSYAIGSFIEGGMNCLLTPAEYMLGARAGGYMTANYFSNGSSNKISIGGQDFYNLMLFPKMENLRSEWGPSPAKRGDEGTLSVAGNSSNRCKESVKGDIRPGSMVSVLLATGSVNIGVSGTVTWRDDNHIYIFGHPFNGMGVVQYPFVQISVADTLQTPLNAYKIPGCHLETKGTIFVDGAFELAGVIGATASMLPYQVELHMGESTAILAEEIAASPLAPAVIRVLPVIWAQQLLGDVRNFSLAYQARITIANQPEIFIKNMIPTLLSKNPFEEVFAKVYSPLQTLRESGFSYGVESIKVHLDVVRDFGLWTSKKSFLSQDKVNPGETVHINIVLEEYSSLATKQISIPIKVPDDFMERIELGGPSTVTVLVQSGSKFTDKRGSPEVTSIEGLIKQQNQSMNYETNVLYVQQMMPKSKAEQKNDKDNAKTAVKPSWKWVDVAPGDLIQFPSENKNDVVLTLSPALNDFIDLNLAFSLTVQSKKDVVVEGKKETKHRKWFFLYLH